MEYDDYKSEIELIMRQNPLECELYSLIATILRNTMKGKDFSLRDVSGLKNKSDSINPKSRMYKGTNIEGDFYGASDFLVIDKKYRYSSGNQNNIYGCIEIKALYLDVEKARKYSMSQFEGELNSFNKLIYTNGLKWEFYNTEYEGSIMSFELGKYVLNNAEVISDKDCIIWKEESAWNVLIEYIKNIRWKEK